jgi:hypothetical protein
MSFFGWATVAAPGDLVYEPFAGGGATLIAAESLGRLLLRAGDRPQVGSGDDRTLAERQWPLIQITSARG